MCPRAETAPAKAVAKEEKILEAARKRFAYFGFPKVTMDEIAAEVRYLINGWFYNHIVTVDFEYVPFLVPVQAA